MSSRSILFAPVILLTCLSAAALCQTAPVHPQAHAHNDYLHKRPLLDALEHGFCSVEADICLVNGELLVAHSRSELQDQRTFRALYLNPLRERVQRYRGSVYEDGQPFTLLIDIKSEGETTYRELHKQLAAHSEMMTYVQDGVVKKGAVTAIVSGNRPVAAIEADSPRYVGIDGRLPDLDSHQPNHLLPLISDNWSLHFTWRGIGKLPEAEREKLRMIVDKAHRHQRRVRFWATPDNAAVWSELHGAQVDLINTDDLDGLSQFLNSLK